MTMTSDNALRVYSETLDLWRSKPGMRAAINAKCIDCIYDPLASGNWREQVEACVDDRCPLHSMRLHSRQPAGQTAHRKPVTAWNQYQRTSKGRLIPKSFLKGPVRWV